MTQNLNETIIKKLEKLYNLWNRNTEGAEAEAEKAKALLDKHLAKYGITLDELFEKKEEVEIHKIHYSTKEEGSIICQCCAYLFGSTSEEWKNFYRYRNGKMDYYLKCSKTSWVLFSDLVEFHLNNWKYELEKMKKNLFYAYLQSQGLYDKDENKQGAAKGKSKRDEMVDMFTILNFSKNIHGRYQQKISKESLRLEVI